AKLYDVFLDQLTMQKSWMLSSALSMLAMDDSFGLTPQEMTMHGIDVYFLLNAQLQQKPVIELEGVKAQVDMFVALSPEAQEKSLV
ncbi:TraB/GumN family protein, partial [Bacillus velezensis]|uniref:TraB/GumN family protein n=1 Tax=Bacillus velezensis TaxID=492670 RepID=UPI0020BF2821